MTYDAIQFWETALDITGLLMCVLTLIYIVRIRLAGRPVKPQPGGFKQEMRARTEDPASENVLETIARALDQERKKLQLYLGTGLQPAFAGSAPKDRRAPDLPDEAAPVYRASGERPRKSGVYSEAMELSACGLTTGQIADKVQLPRGEVELSLKLLNRRKRNR